MKKKNETFEKYRKDLIETISALEKEESEAIPPKLRPLWQPKRYKIITGGRGSAKSWTVAKILTIEASKECHKILCTREIQESLKVSVYDLLKYTCQNLVYPGWVFHNDEIFNTITGSCFLFAGLRDLRAAKSIKSYFNIDRAWVEEAEAVSKESWEILTPTIRGNKDNSEIYATFNRYDEFDPVYLKYCMVPDPDVLFIEINWRENPWFPDVLRKEKDKDRREDYDLYLHKWENHPIAALEKAVISQEAVNEACRRILTPDPYDRQTIGIDTARYGDDKTKVYERRGNIVRKLFERKHEAPIITAREVAAHCDSKYTQINADNGGLGGGGMNDALRDMGFQNVIDINFGGTAKDSQKYKDVATEMYLEARDLMPFIQLPDILTLKQDLYGRKFTYLNDEYNRRKIEPKEEFKKRYQGRSPDDGDACLLCLYDPGGSIKHDPEIQKALTERRQKISRQNRSRFIS